MERIGVESIKQAYAQKLIDEGSVEKGLNVYNKDVTAPVFEGLAFHPESEPVMSLINEAMADISIDLAGLSQEMATMGTEYEALISDIQTRLAAVDERISAEEDRIRDINIICGNYNQFDSILTLTPDNTTGSYSYKNNTFYGPTSEVVEADLKVTDVQGNGVEGNPAIKDAAPLRSDRGNLIDSDTLTGWEYSRFTSSTAQAGMSVPVNVDSEEARCTVSFESETPFNSIIVRSDDDLVVEGVRTSTDDGLTYIENLAKDVHINSKEHRYNEPEYAYESGIIAFPTTQYLKLQVRSNGATNDKVLDRDGSVREGVVRHRISIEDVQADASAYSTATIETENLVSNPVGSIAIFANEYVPPHFTQGDYFEYIMSVNGVDYQLVPINSNRAGTKIIRFSDYSAGDSYIAHINESIKTAKLKVVIHSTEGGGTPYLGNLKVCLGNLAVS